MLAFIERKPAAFEALAPFDPVPGRSAEPDPAELIEAGSGKPFRDNSANGDPCVRCPELVVVPSGTFNMGSTEGEAWRLDWQREREAPSTNVAIAKPLAVARFAVTFDEWAACAAAGDCLDTPGDSGWGRGNRPVINITWDEANAYVGWLSRKTGRSYRLLSEAEREYMARAGTATPFWFGTAPAPKQANYLPVSAGGNTSTAPSTEMTLPVNSFEPNPWGLYNVHGNVWDWTADCWNDNHRGHSGTGAAVLTGDCRHRVLKGGSWFHPPMLMRAAARTRASTDLRANSIGLRVVRNIGSGARN